MSKYDYYTQVTVDAIDYIRDAIKGGYLNTRDFKNGYELFEKLNDEMWIADSVTGNGSGSYTFNSFRAAEYVTDNPDLVREMIREYCIDAQTVCDKFLDGEWEWFDVSCRCYVLGYAIDKAIEQLEETGEIIYAEQEAM